MSGLSFRPVKVQFGAHRRASKVLILYASTEGQAAKIADFLRQQAEERGHEAWVQDLDAEPSSPGNSNLVVVVASMHREKYKPSVLRYIRQNRAILEGMRTGFVSVSLSAASHREDSRQAVENIARTFLRNAGWVPDRVEHAAGALAYSKYGLLKRRIMRSIARREGGDTDTARDYEYTDWVSLARFLDQMLDYPDESAEPGSTLVV